MLEFLIHLAITAALLMLVANAVKGVHIDGWGSAFIAALVLGLVNGVVRPVMVFLTIPITVVTLGLFLLVVNALMLWLVAAVSPGIKVEGFGPAFWGALLLTVLNILVSWIFGMG
ncbi:MAG: phage holin family protein [Gammaproteobacteria bacterium]|nr:MAG: phage holin family protein [Gammaproteobacteria bacterium]